MKMTVPLTGTSVKPEGEGPAVNGATAAPAQTPVETQDTQQPGRQSLHNVRMQPAEVPEQEYRWTWNQFGKAKLVPIEQAEAPQETGETVDGEQLDAGGYDASAGQYGTPPLPGSQYDTAGQSAQSGDVSALQAEIKSLTQTVNLLAQMQMQGATPKPAAPAPPQPPDPAQFDLYDPEQFKQFTQLNHAYTDALVQYKVNAAMEPHGQTLQDARLNMEYNGVLAARGHDPNFQGIMQNALQLKAKFPNISIPEAYDYMASMQPTPSPRQSAATTSQPVAKPARTITAQEAAQKAEQARRLPASNGVSGAGQAALPSHIKGLGDIMAWNKQYGRAI